jgi:hypothetical protein
LTIRGTSTGYSQPLVRIEQLGSRDGSYCLQTIGYSDFNGIRINGADTGNTIFTTGNNDMGLTTNTGVMKFNVNGAERMCIGTSGIVDIVNSLQLRGKEIKYNLFNNSGLSHTTTTDFNAISEYGFRYIFSPASNSPNSSFTGWYSWYMGLGSEYNNNYGAQILFARNVAGPRFFVRYKEGAGFGSWAEMTSFFADTAGSLTTGNKAIQSNLQINGTCSPNMLSVANSGNDYTCVQVNAVQGSAYNSPICIAVGTFTGFHRPFLDNEPLYDNENPQKFKDDYVGRLVISTGKIATDTRQTPEDEWEIKYDKEGITIEDAVFMVQLSRTKRDKRIIGVLGMASHNNSRPERMIVNSVGEGAIWVINSNGNFENGDLITTSDYLGYGELQGYDLIRDYTCGKITIDCDFQLDSPYYNCYEIDDLDHNGNKLRVAFVACVYYCG